MREGQCQIGGTALSLAIGCALYVGSGAVWSQTPSQAADVSQGVTELGEIIITANKVSEDLEKAAVSVTALSGTELANLGATTVTDLSSVIPNFTAAPNSNGSTVAIRGIVSTAQSATGDSEVAYTMDGVPVINKLAQFQGMFDVDRVEVLRGPQGTDYGANANAGAVNIITRKPDLTQESGTAYLGMGNYNTLNIGGAFNMPLSDVLAVRIAVDHQYHDGYIDLLTNSSRFDDMDLTQGRVHVLFNPTEDVSALLTYEEAHDGGAGDGGAGSGAPLGLYEAQQPNISPFSYEAMPGEQSLDELIRSMTANLTWTTPYVDVNFLGNIRSLWWAQSDPETIYGPDAKYCQNITNPTQCYNPGISHNYDRQTSEELRFSKEVDGLHWLVGFFHIKDNYSINRQLEPAPFNPNLWAETYATYFEQDKAVYSQLKYDISDQLSVIGGIRYQNDVKDEPTGGEATAPIGSFTGNECTNCTPIAHYDGYGNWNKATWHVGVNYQMTQQNFLYASVATGYESGGFSTGGTIPLNPAYGPENVTNYEIGSKNRFWDNRAEVNIDGFYMNYTGYQVTSSILAPNGDYETVTLNAGKAHIRGIELESTFLVTPLDKIAFNATTMDAVFTDFYLPNGDGYVNSPTGRAPTNYTGNQLPYAPHATARLAFEHTFPFGDVDSVVAHADMAYSSHYYLDYHDFTAVAQGGYTKADGFVSWAHKRNERTFTTQLYVRNIENKAILAGGQGDSSAPNKDFNEYGKNGYYLPPRTYGVLFTANF
jgi:iron complex outermembrane recepter protein